MAKEISILVLENDPGSQAAIQMMVDGEGWKVRLVDGADAGMRELAQGPWALVVANLALADFSSPLFHILKELALSPPVEDGKSRVRVLFVVPAADAPQLIPVLDKDGLPHTIKPYQFNEFIEKVNDLLLQAQFLTKTSRERGFASEQRANAAKGKKEKKAGAGSMFASRDDYYYTDEELAEYEKEEQEQRKKKKKLTERPL